MSTFLDGPAAGTRLSLASSPFFLRAVRAPGGKWDALDQHSDTPADNEEIHVYRRATDPITAHIDGRDPKTGRRYGRWTSSADYVLHSEQPDDATARTFPRWECWCAAQDSRPAPSPLNGQASPPDK